MGIDLQSIIAEEKQNIKEGNLRAFREQVKAKLLDISKLQGQKKEIEAKITEKQKELNEMALEETDL